MSRLERVGERLGLSEALLGIFRCISNRRLVRISGGNTWMCPGVYGFHAYRAIDLEPPSRRVNERKDSAVCDTAGGQ
jgi:hypothetical protein